MAQEDILWIFHATTFLQHHGLVKWPMTPSDPTVLTENPVLLEQPPPFFSTKCTKI